jgi:UDP-3-O-[3-hydroxymyristoyl] glucosamine N-acyltransferase
MVYTLAELAHLCDGHVIGDGTIRIQDVATLEGASDSDIAYVAEPKYRDQLAITRAGAVILSQSDAEFYSGNSIVAADPKLAYARIAQLLHAPVHPGGAIDAHAIVHPEASVAESAYVGPGAVVERGAQIGERVYIGAGCVIGEEADIGADSWLHARVVVAHHCRVGKRCILQSGVVVGGDGFGYARDREHRWVKIPQVGRAILGDDVEIGANSTVDRGAQGDTVVGDGVKIDNLVQIAHNVRLGENTAIAAGAGVAGSAIIGKRCAIGGQAGIFGHIQIADDVTVAGKSMVAKSIAKPGVYSSALRVETLETWQRIAARLRRLDDFAKRLEQIEQRLEQERKE